jgi:hypothetical protein
MPTTIDSAGITFNDTTSLTSANIGTAQLVNGSVTTIKLAPSSVDGTKLSSQAVSYGNLSTDLTKRVVHAWVNFSGVSGAIRNSYNVSSVSVFGTGQYGINFAVGAASGNYAFAGMCGNGTENPASVATESVIVTSTLSNIITIMTVLQNSNAVNLNWVSVIVFQS